MHSSRVDERCQQQTENKPYICSTQKCEEKDEITIAAISLIGGLSVLPLYERTI
jgi:hypothetical protein